MINLHHIDPVQIAHKFNLPVLYHESINHPPPAALFMTSMVMQSVAVHPLKLTGATNVSAWASESSGGHCDTWLHLEMCVAIGAFVVNGRIDAPTM